MKINTNKMLIAGVILLIIWLSFLWFLVNYGKELKNHPCNLCAKKIGDDVTCYNLDQHLTFTPEGIVENEGIQWGNPKL